MSVQNCAIQDVRQTGTLAWAEEKAARITAAVINGKSMVDEKNGIFRLVGSFGQYKSCALPPSVNSFSLGPPRSEQ